MKIKLNVNTEYDTLKEAIVGLPNTFNTTGRLMSINATEDVYFDSPLSPRRSLVAKEVRSFAGFLRTCGVKVHYPEPLEGTIDQLTPRDLGFVVGDTFVVSHMAYMIREKEKKGIAAYLDHFDGRIVKAPADVVVEGGDILVDGEDIYVGVGERTNNAGYEFIRKTFKDHNAHRLQHRALHLDCVFNILGGRNALIYDHGLRYRPRSILERFRLIDVPAAEYEMLAVNVLSLSQDTIVSRMGCVETNRKLRDCGYEVMEIEYDEVPKTGGSFRCCTLPLSRV